MIQARIISAVVFFVLFFLGLFSPWWGWALPLILVVAACMGGHEVLHFGRDRPSMTHVLLTLAGIVWLLADAYYFQLSHAFVILGLLTVLTLAMGLIRFDHNVAELSGKSLLALTYVGLPMAIITLIWRQPVNAGLEHAQHYLLFLVLVTWSSDIGAFFVGRKFGRQKLAPRVSPGKSKEGFFGGIIVTVLIAVLMKLFWNNIRIIFSWPEVIFLALAFSIVGPFGDLAESHLKRQAGVKDSGRTFTGHGGMLDIIDSLLFTTILYYVYLWVFHRWVILPTY